MKTILIAAFAFAVAAPAVAQEASPTEGVIDATFTWTATDVGTVPAGASQLLRLRESTVIVTAGAPGPIDRLAGRCLLTLKVDQSSDGYTGTGSCEFIDADGDILFEEVSEENGVGSGVVTGSTGKFAGLTAEYTYEIDWYGSIREGMDQGFGTKKGTWKKSGS